MNLLIVRDYKGVDCSMGKISIEEQTLILDSMERPWIPAADGSPCGHPDLSCVPPGVYQLVLHDTPKHPRTWALVNPELGIYAADTDIPAGTTGRSECLLHPANWAFELLGCIAPGLSRSIDGTTWMVRQSDTAMLRLQALVPWENGHTLTIQ